MSMATLSYDRWYVTILNYISICYILYYWAPIISTIIYQPFYTNIGKLQYLSAEGGNVEWWCGNILLKKLPELTTTEFPSLKTVPRDRYKHSKWQNVMFKEMAAVSNCIMGESWRAWSANDRCENCTESKKRLRITRRNCSGVPTSPEDCGPNTYQLISVLGRINLSRRLEAWQRGTRVIFSHFLRRPLQLCQSCLFSLSLRRRLGWWRASSVQAAVRPIPSLVPCVTGGRPSRPWDGDVFSTRPHYCQNYGHFWDDRRASGADSMEEGGWIEGGCCQARNADLMADQVHSSSCGL